MSNNTISVLVLYMLLLSIFSSTSMVFTSKSVAEARVKSKSRAKSTTSQIVVMGFVYCDICSNNTFSKHSYFLPGAEVKIDCTLKALSPRTAEQISFSVNRTTNRHGIYRLEIQAIDGIKCAEESAIASACQATLMWSSSSSCNVPGYRLTSDQIAIKSKRDNLCFYTLTPLNFRPNKRQTSLCGN